MSDPKTVLIVDDTPSNIHVIKNILEGHYKIKAATSGGKALQIVGKVPPDLILLDVMMPEMDGYEVCRRLKADPSTAGIPVLFVTGLADDADEQAKGIALGAVAYVNKPVDPEELLAHVARWAGQAR
jgi:putative two-component system response regulator